MSASTDHSTAANYDRVASEYAAQFFGELAHKPLVGGSLARCLSRGQPRTRPLAVPAVMHPLVTAHASAHRVVLPPRACRWREDSGYSARRLADVAPDGGWH